MEQAVIATTFLTWYESLFMIGTNLAAILPVVLSFRLGLWYIGIQMILSMVFSVIYHTCDSTGFCLFGYSLLVWKTMDYIYAFMQIVVIFVFLVDFEANNNSPDSFLRQRWAVVMQQLFTPVVILVILADPFSRDAAYVIITLGAMLIYGKFIFLDKGGVMLNNRFEPKFIVAGGLLFLIGVVLFSINGTPVYWLLHSTWHLAAYLGQYFLILGGTKHYKGWYNYVGKFCSMNKEDKKRRKSCCRREGEEDEGETV